jgi:Ca2+-binding RTX toxin-like protein
MPSSVFFNDVSPVIEENATVTPEQFTLGADDDEGDMIVSYETDPASPFEAVRKSSISGFPADDDVWILVVRAGAVIDFDALDPATQNALGQRVLSVDINVQDSAETNFQGTLEVRVTNVSGVVTGTPGNDYAPPLAGTPEEDLIQGLAGNDLLIGGKGNDTLDGGGNFDTASYAAATAPVTVDLAAGTADAGSLGSDTLIGIEAVIGSNLSGDDLRGDGGVNLLDGGAGADIMRGLGGNDSYVVDNAGDDIAEAAGADIDTVQSYLSSYTLPTNFEQLVLLGNATAGTGNDADNVLIGIYSTQSLTLDGGSGNDALYGSAQNDTLFGGEGSDYLIGGGGTNSLQGGGGDDVYVVSSSTDTFVEAAGGGTDTVYSSATNTTLGINLETLVLTGSAATGAGNGLSNTIVGFFAAGPVNLDGAGGNDVLYGSAFSDTLIGGEGNDFLIGEAGTNRLEGGAGNDIYVVSGSLDLVVEEADGGNDVVYTSAANTMMGANIETLVMRGSAISATGNNSNNVILGNYAAGLVLINGEGGDDIIFASDGGSNLNGGFGNDVLFAGAGADLFIFGPPDSGSDVIFGFQDGTDLIKFGNQSGISGFADLNLYNIDGFGSLIVAGSALVWVEGVSITNLTAADFQFT